MKILNLLYLVLLVGCASAQNTQKKADTEKTKYNILFIAVDDLKPYINSFGYAEVKTPNLDKLAKMSTIFNANYCQQAVCAPTRASLLTGLRPDKTEVFDLQTLIRDKNPDIVTLPQYLKANGYVTSAMGKIFDPRSVDKNHDEVSWSVPYKNKFKYAEGYEDIVIEAYQSPEMKAKFKELQAQREANKNKKGDKNQDFDNPKITRDDIKVSTESADVPDDAYFDGAMTKYAQRMLREAKDSEQPFFMGVGFHKPHLPFVAPKKYWDMYDRDKIQVANWQKPAIDGPEIAYHNAGELRSFKDISAILKDAGIGMQDPIQLSEEKQKELIHGYYACISYVDAQVGILLNTLKAQGLDKNTIIVFWGDHGWHFGDHNLWAKHSNFEQATKAPLMITVPGMTNGKIYTQPSEFLDIFPTLCELNGIETPNYLDGKSLVPALKNNDASIKDFAISQYPRKYKGKNYMGYSIRTSQYRYTEWMGPDFTTEKPYNEALLFANELYDLNKDPEETTNIVNQANTKADLTKLKEQLQSFYLQQYKTAKERM